MAEGRIFINYRRDDSRADSGRLYDRLAARFPGRVFRDVASLEPGVEWHDAINRVLGQSDACIVVIGSNWVDIKDASGRRRLDDPNDTVRLEVMTALSRQMRVFPVLVGGAKMPSAAALPVDLQSLCRRNALEISEQDWDEDLAKLIKALEIALGVGPNPPPVDRASGFKKWGLAALGAMAALVLLFVYMGQPKPPVPEPVKPNPIHEQIDNPPVEKHRSPPSKKVSVEPKIPVEPEIPVEPPRRTAPVVPRVVGNWDAVLSQAGQQVNERVEFYGDASFRAMLRGSAVAVGRWRYNSGTGALDITNSTDLTNGVKFACTSKSLSSDQFSGGCQDRLGNSYTVSLTRGGGSVPEPPYSIPHVNLSSLTMAERAAFVQLLASRPCTCNCRMTVLVCLDKDRNCKFSPNLAQTALANFLRVTRG